MLPRLFHAEALQGKEIVVPYRYELGSIGRLRGPKRLTNARENCLASLSIADPPRVRTASALRVRSDQLHDIDPDHVLQGLTLTNSVFPLWQAMCNAVFPAALDQSIRSGTRSNDRKPDLSLSSSPIPLAEISDSQTSQYILLILTAAWNVSIFFFSVAELGVSGDGSEARRCRMVLFSES